MKKSEKKSIVTTIQSFSDFFGSKKASDEWINQMNGALSYSYQPERLNPEDASYSVCDSPNTANK